MRTYIAASLLVALGLMSVNAQNSSASAAMASAALADVTSIPSSVLNDTRTASSNFTLPKPTATATLPPNFVMQSSNPFVYADVDTTNLPKIKYTLLNETVEQRQIVCDQQTKFCKTAGCADATATITHNVCNVDTMAVMCRCSKGASNLDQWKWPVQFQDCLRRGNTCQNACQIPGGTTASRNDCKQACQKSFADTCGFPNQYAANYAVKKENGKPSFAMIQGGDASSAMNVRVATGLVLFAASAATLALMA